MLYGGIEGGGTKMICAVGNEKGEILERVSIPTRSPEDTVPAMIDFFKGKEIAALGIGCFGPIDLNKKSKTYGYITSTPKLAWRDYDFVGAFEKALGVPVGFDTDVNGSLLGEITWGCAKDKANALYLTIGTGIGGGVMSNGQLLHGMLHPELGHIRLQPAPGDKYQGKCPYHGICFEGMASGPAIEERWGDKAYNLADKKEVWELESYYIAQALSDFIVTLSPEIIILGGGVMNQEHLFPLIRKKTLDQLGGYIKTKELEDIDNYIVPASLGGDQGIMGAIKLAMEAYQSETSSDTAAGRSSKNKLIQTILDYIDNNLYNKVQLNEVAEALELSPAYLSVLFKKTTGVGFSEYIYTKKIEKAKEMLLSRDMKIYEVAEALGFESAYYFSKVFKKVDGHSPREYIQKNIG